MQVFRSDLNSDQFFQFVEVLSLAQGDEDVTCLDLSLLGGVVHHYAGRLLDSHNDEIEVTPNA